MLLLLWSCDRGHAGYSATVACGAAAAGRQAGSIQLPAGAAQAQSRPPPHSTHLPSSLPTVPSATQKRKEKAGAGLKGKEDGLTPLQRKERDAKALQEKMAKKAAEEAAKK